jgi:hypothetical protein
LTPTSAGTQSPGPRNAGTTPQPRRHSPVVRHSIPSKRSLYDSRGLPHYQCLLGSADQDLDTHDSLDPEGTFSINAPNADPPGPRIEAKRPAPLPPSVSAPSRHSHRRRTYAAWFCTEHPRGIVVAGHADDSDHRVSTPDWHAEGWRMRVSADLDDVDAFYVSVAGGARPIGKRSARATSRPLSRPVPGATRPPRPAEPHSGCPGRASR